MTDYFHDFDISGIKIPEDEFLKHIQGNMRKDKRYCFILGAGTSVSSGLPSANELTDKWLGEMKKMSMNDDTLFKGEGDDKVIRQGVKNNPAKYYSYIYQKRFALDREGGYLAIEEAMKKTEKNEPKTGYRLLAKILKDHRSFNIVITTNFDRLTEDAISTVGKSPQVIGHESLAEFAKPLTTTPTVIKIHRDLLFHLDFCKFAFGTVNTGIKRI